MTPSRSARHGQDRLDRADRADRVAERATWGVDRRLVAAHRVVDRLALGHVADAGAGGVRVDVVDVGGAEARELDGPRHRVPGLLTVGVGRHDVVAVRGDAGAHQPGEDVGAARLCVLLGLDDHQRAALAEHETVAVLVERAAGTGRIVVGGGQHDPHLGEPGDGHRLDLGLHATADRDVGLAEHDVAPRVRDAFGAGRAGRDRGDDPGLGLAFQPDGRGCARWACTSARPAVTPHAGPWRACRRRRTAVPRLEPMPVPIDTINRVVSTSGEPAFSQTRRPSTVDIFCRYDSRRSSTRVSSPSKSSSRWPPMRTGRSYCSTNGSSSVRIPLCPSSSFFQVVPRRLPAQSSSRRR